MYFFRTEAVGALKRSRAFFGLNPCFATYQLNYLYKRPSLSELVSALDQQGYNVIVLWGYSLIVLDTEFIYI